MIISQLDTIIPKRIYQNSPGNRYNLSTGKSSGDCDTPALDLGDICPEILADMDPSLIRFIFCV